MSSRAACGTDPVARDGAKRKHSYSLIDEGYDGANPRPCDVLLAFCLVAPGFFLHG